MTVDHLNRLRRMLSQVAPGGFSQELKESLEARKSVAATETLDVQHAKISRAEAEIAEEALDVLRQGETIDADHRFALEAIVMPFHRPVVDIIESRMKADQLGRKWNHLSEAGLRERIEHCFLSVGRIDIPSLPTLPYAGTGFIVGPDLLMTNRHVAEIFSQGLGRHTLQFRSGHSAIYDCYHEIGNTKSEALDVAKVVMIHPYWDMALLKVRGLTDERPYFTLSITDPGAMTDREVVVIGYPGYDPTADIEFQQIQNRIFRGTYYVKRMQPGQLRQRKPIPSFGREVQAITHDSSTLGGNSGSVMLVLPEDKDEAIQIAGLHFAGEYLVANYAVSTADLAADSRIVDAGVKFAGQVEPRSAFYSPFWEKIDTEGDALGSEHPGNRSDLMPPPIIAQQRASAGTTAKSWTIPIEVSITVGEPEFTGAPTDRPEAQHSVEGLLGGQPSIPTASLPYRLSVSSLAEPQFTWPMALSLALASRLAYEQPVAVQALACGAWGFEKCQFIEMDDTQCFVVSNSQIVLVAFRGTESMRDFWADINVRSRTRHYGQIHRGFLSAFEAVEAQLSEAIAALPNRTLLLTGHSLGGALATVAAAEWYNRFPAKWIMTYGQPAVGKGAFTQFMKPQIENFIRFVNDDDIITRVPPTYHHVGRRIYFDAAGNVPPRAALESLAEERMLNEAEFDRIRAQMLESRSRLRGAGLESLEAPVEEGLLSNFSDHKLDNYISKIARYVAAAPGS